MGRIPVLWVAVGLVGTVLGAPKVTRLPEKLEIILEDNCWSCHEAGMEKGDLRLDNLNELPKELRLKTLDRIQEQVFFKQMPPREKKQQPSHKERTELLTWLSGELHKHDASTLEDKLRYPDYGNAIDHDKLFSGENKDQASTPARRWLVSPQIFHQRVLDVFELEGRYRGMSFYGVTNPFILPEKSGVRYYDKDLLNGGHLIQMMGNAQWIAGKQIHLARVKNGEIGAGDFEDKRDSWVPRKSTPEFEVVVLHKGEATTELMTAAIRKQFALVLRRAPSDAEMKKYLALMGEAVKLGGNTEGLRQMLVAVLLESEFLYRLEFGEGEADEHGRKMLSSREGAYAISYALGDRGPDATLLKAAAEGKLTTREDYRREVVRLLADENYYRGPIDPAFSTSKSKSPITSHPKINRFFREFFGYPAAAKVFKDPERSGGYYSNPGRGTLATPGFLVNEADRIVEWHLVKDKDVFWNILTSDDFFVYHDRTNEQGETIIREWREVYEKLKDTPWQTEPEKVLAEHWEFIKAKPSMKRLGEEQVGHLVNFMQFFGETFGQGTRPFTTVPWAHGYTFHHSPFYNLPPTPGIFRYGHWKNTRIANLKPKAFWDYEPVQPMKLDHRKGILTHPAWLIAHSTNFHADAIRRGRWIREKLLSGRVPDVPITVDALVPEDHHRTFRDRVVEVTSAKECWKCHQYMNPLGLAFEMYDDFGRFRTEESLENDDNLIRKGDGKRSFNVYKTLPINTSGELSGTGNPKLDGKVTDALDLIERVARSDRSRQSIIRHAFRFYMGRNEQLSDSQTLIDADRAYVESGGSFRAVIISLLTSDSFIYRKP